MDIYVVKDGERYGPHTTDEIQALITSGQLTREDSYWAQGMPEWQPLSILIPPPIPTIRQTVPISTTTAEQANARQSNVAVRRLAFAPLVLTLLAFFMPFIEVSCTVQRNISFKLTGLQLATGTEIQTPEDLGTARSQRIHPVLSVTIALVCAIGALLVYFIHGTKVGTSIISGTGVISLLMFNSECAQEVAKQTQGAFVTTFLVGFWLAVIGLVGCIAVLILPRASANSPLKNR